MFKNTLTCFHVRSSPGLKWSRVWLNHSSATTSYWWLVLLSTRCLLVGGSPRLPPTMRPLWKILHAVSSVVAIDKIVIKWNKFISDLINVLRWVFQFVFNKLESKVICLCDSTTCLFDLFCDCGSTIDSGTIRVNR